MSSPLKTYAQLLENIDAKFAQIRSHHPASFRCTAGCHSCCKPDLTVSPLEAAALRQYLIGRPDLVAELRALAAADPHGGTRCSFLRADGACAVYDARPIVCRSHGAPLTFRLEAHPSLQRDVCPLNFTDTPLDQLPAGDVINLDTLNTILALLNQQVAGTGEEALSRTRLTVDALGPDFSHRPSGL